MWQEGTGDAFLTCLIPFDIVYGSNNSLVDNVINYDDDKWINYGNVENIRKKKKKKKELNDVYDGFHCFTIARCLNKQN